MKNIKLTALLLTAVMTAGMFTACGKTDEQPPAPENSEVTSAEPSVKDTHKSDTIRDLTASELVSEMKIGWNLGNTLDSVKGGSFIDDPLAYEKAWGNPVTTSTMIDMVKNQGFNVLRVPVTWYEHIGEAPDYKIDEKWMDRVQEVVNYGIDNDMFVILNLHHEEWHMPTYDNLETAKAELAAVWKQIAERFGGYDEHLIFEGMNEPRLKGTPMEWTGGNDEARDCINQLDQVFVDTVRATGGNNPKRCLMVPTYAASSDQKVIDQFIVPEDDRVIVSIHAYLPYSFALADDGTTEFSKDNVKDTNDIDLLFARLKDRFLDKGIPVVIGEFGTRNRFNTEARVECAEYYLSRAKEYGVPCVWWDNNAFVSGEAFGLLNRAELTWRYPEIMDAIFKTVNEEEAKSE